MKLVALDIALLLPSPVAELAIELSQRLPAEQDDRLRLNESHRPHVTLAQLYVREEELEAVLDRVGTVVSGRAPLNLHVPGGGTGSSSVWMTIDRSPELDALHEDLMEALRGFERQGGTSAAFYAEDARVGDVLWVSSYRLKSAFGAFVPHVTLGPGQTPPSLAPFDFTASTVAACHLGRFCSCRHVFREWTL